MLSTIISRFSQAIKAQLRKYAASLVVQFTQSLVPFDEEAKIGSTV